MAERQIWWRGPDHERGEGESRRMPVAVTSPDGAYYPVAPGQGAEVSGLFSSRNVFVQYALRRSRDRPRAESESTCSPIVNNFLTLTPPLPHAAKRSRIIGPRSTTARTGSWPPRAERREKTYFTTRSRGAWMPFARRFRADTRSARRSCRFWWSGRRTARMNSRTTQTRLSNSKRWVPSSIFPNVRCMRPWRGWRTGTGREPWGVTFPPEAEGTR